MMPFEEGSVNFLALLVILTNVFAFMLILFLFLGKSKENRGNLLLSLMILQYALWVFPEFLHLFGLLDDFPHAVRIYVFGAFLLGPITYFYVRTCTEKNFRITPKMGWHFIPALIDFFFQLPFYTLDGADKLQYFYNFFSESAFQQPLWLTIAKQVQMLIYIFVSIRIIQRYRNHLNNTASSIDAAFHRWLFLFCISLAIPIFAGFAYNFINADFATFFVIGSMFLVQLTAFSLLVIKPSLFTRFPHQIIEQDLANNLNKEKYESSKLKEAQKEQYVQKLIAFFELKKPFQSSELTLKELAEQVNIPAHYLSQVINEKLDTNFIDFINDYRVKAAQELLIDPKLSHYTIVSIAYEAGFNAKSTFYAVFKKHTGMTPSAYRKQTKQVY